MRKILRGALVDLLRKGKIEKIFFSNEIDDQCAQNIVAGIWRMKCS